jgi:PKD repeat protein
MKLRPTQGMLIASDAHASTRRGIEALVLFWLASAMFLVAQSQPPSCILSVTPARGLVPLQVIATGGCTDLASRIDHEVLDWGDASSTQIHRSSFGSFSLPHTYSSAGSFTVSVIATDRAGNQGKSSQQVLVTANVPPTCTLSLVPTTGVAPLEVTATGNCANPDGDTLTTVVDWGDGTSTSAVSGTHTYSSSGVFQVVLTATDAAGGTGTATQTVTVTPAPICFPQVSPASGKAPLLVTVTANCSVVRDQIVTTILDFGDGFYQSGLSATHTYASSGTFTLTVTAVVRTGKPSSHATVSVSVSDVPTLFVGVSNGQIEQFDTTGNLLTTLNTNQGGSTTGMAFDSLGALYVTDFTADTVTKFDGSGKLVGSFGSGYNCKPESIVFDESGNAYVGETGCSHAIVKFDAYGNLLAGYAVTTENEGSDWIELAPDHCTIFYTSQGTTVFRFNACNSQQGSPFATGLNTGLALKFLPDGGMLVANNQNIVRLDSAGRTIGQYNASGENCWVSLTLDPDGTSFWAVDYCSSDVVQFDINSGNQLAKFNSGTPTQTVFGVAMRTHVPSTTPAGVFIASPQSVTVSAGQTGTLQLNFTPVAATMGQDFSFSCANLPIGTSCSFSPQTLTATSGTTISLTVNTTKTAASLSPWRYMPLPVYALWPVGILLWRDIRPKRRGNRFNWIAFIALLTLLGAMLACGGSSTSKSSNSNPTPPPPSPSSMTTPAGTYSIVVRATAKSSASATVVSLKVQ